MNKDAKMAQASLGNWSFEDVGSSAGNPHKYGFILSWKTVKAYPTFDQWWAYPIAFFQAVRAIRKERVRV